MKAAIYYGVKDIRIEEAPDPVCGPSDVVVRSVRTGICGSDIKGYFINGMLSGNFPGREIGHEMAGRVVEVGADVQGIRAGDRVFVNPIHTCIPGESDMMGGFSEYVKVPNAKIDFNIYLLPDDISYDEGALIEPCAVGTRGKNRPGAKPGDHVVIYGAGAIGIACATALVAQGIQPVVVVRHNGRREILERVGAAVCNVAEVDLFEFLKSHFGMSVHRMGYPAVDVDIVVDCAGGANVIDDFCKMGKRGSRLSLVGVPNEPIPVSTGRILSSEACIMGSCAYEHEDIREVIDILESKKSLLPELITHHFKPEEIDKAFETANDHQNALKVIVDME
ncbi:MAG: alcohol dehydrogenase catalytic domain-containing protein [Clostridiales Family XIII bacterium]|jgi:2-desacetyl-2-hydroxyethyl bacteriochlorophyllide A dehydrogenase|nr:alcohol dehydrogenase catalytic domain-containing protein [Clostridiales Family XIII bacterium]